MRSSQHSGRSHTPGKPGPARKPSKGINLGIKNFRKQSIESIEEEPETASRDDEKFLESVLGQAPAEAEE